LSQVGRYIFTILAGAFASSVISIVLDNKSPVMSMVRMICGLLLTITALSPLLDIQIPDLTKYYSHISTDSKFITETGIDIARSEQMAIISEQTSAYILEKAKMLNLDLTAQVVCSDDAIPIPESVYITGAAAPFAKTQLSAYIAAHLGIPEERQIWN